MAVQEEERRAIKTTGRTTPPEVLVKKVEIYSVSGIKSQNSIAEARSG
jgi:hypothetical protein